MKRRWLWLVPVLLIGVVLCTPRLREQAQEIVRPYAEQAAGFAGELLNTVPKPDGLSLEKPEAADPSSGPVPGADAVPSAGVVSQESSAPSPENPGMAAAGPDSPSAADSFAGSTLADPPPGTPDSAIPYLSTRYYITHLPERLREDFDRLYTAAAAFETSCKLPVRISGADVELLMMVLLYDCPEMFQISRNAEYQIWTVNGEVTEIEIPYLMPLSLYEKKLEQCEGLIQSIGEELQGLSDAEKERRVYDILAGTVSYETEKEDDGTAYGALIRHRAKCDGISLAMKWLMDSFGIPSLVLSGREAGDPRGHAWNSIMINGKYRDVDVTNDTREEGKLMNLYGAYNIDRSWIASIYPLTGVIADHFDVPPSGGMEESFHVLDGSFVPAGTDAADASFALFDRAYAGGGLARLQFEAEEDYRSFLDSFEENTQNWFQTNVLGGSVLLNSLDAFRTAAVQVEFDGQEDIKD